MRAAVSLALALMTAPAIADSAHEVPARARALAERGRLSHDRGDYPSAISAFTEAYALAPSPALLFNLAQAYRLAGRCDEAVVMYNRYLASDPDPDARSLAETHLHSVQLCSARSRAVASVADAGPIDETPAPERHAAIERAVGGALVVGGGVAVLGAVYYAYRAHEDADTVSAAYAHGGSWQSIKDIDERGRDSATVAEVLGGAGVAAVTAGVVLYLMGDRHPAIAPLAVVPQPGGAEVHAAWRF